MPLNRDRVVDGYEPFTDGMLATQFRIALTWRPH
jgi:hypothetical protein